MSLTRRGAAAAGLVGVIVGLSACGSGSGAAAAHVDASDWKAVLHRADGQQVNFYLYGGDSTLNSFLTSYVAPRLNQKGVTLLLVKVADTSDALNTMLAQKQAGKTSGTVDAVWVNGENFATGRQARLWSCGWPDKLPNARYVDFHNSAVRSDFGIPVKGCESVWQQADSALVYNSAKLGPKDVRSMSTLFAWAKAHPGQFTYPAPPDFTGSMAIRTILYDTIGGPSALPASFDKTKYEKAATRLWKRLRAIRSALWRGGSTYPQSEDQVERMYADGQLAAYFTYGPGAVSDKVAKGRYPASTREAVLAGGNIANFSFIGIPKDAGHYAGALVLANLLQDPATQLALYKAEGIYPGIDLAKTSKPVRAEFAAVPRSPSVLPLTTLTRHAQPELASGYVSRLEHDWKTHVEQQ